MRGKVTAGFYFCQLRQIPAASHQFNGSGSERLNSFKLGLRLGKKCFAAKKFLSSPSFRDRWIAGFEGPLVLEA